MLSLNGKARTIPSAHEHHHVLVALGNVAEAVIRHSRVPVLVLPLSQE